MYIAVTPLIHSIRGKDKFTYRVDETSTGVQVGQLVWIPWRSKTILGVVRETKQVSELAKAKYIYAVLPLVIPLVYQDFIEWFSKFYAISLSHAYYLAWPQFTTKTLVATPLQAPEVCLQRTGLSVKADTILLSHDEQISQYIEACWSSAPGTIVVLVAEIQQANRLATLLADHVPYLITSETSAPILRQAFLHCWRGAQRQLIIGTKLISLWPLQSVAKIIMVEPEDFSHKQWGMNPRYHVYRLVDYWQRQGVPTTYLSYCPRVEQYYTSAIKLDWRSTKTGATVTTVAMQQQSKLSMQILERLQAAQVAVIWHQHKGKADLLVCQNCSTVTLDTARVRCLNCQSPGLRIRGFGTTDLVNLVQTLLPDRPAIEITKDLLTKPIDYSSQPIIIGTSALKNALDWKRVEYVAVASVDYLLSLAQFRAHEVLLQQLTWLKYHCPILDIQTYVPDHPVFTALSQLWPADWFERVVIERRRFKFPPFGERIEIQHVKTRQRRIIQQLSDLPDDQNLIIDRET